MPILDGRSLIFGDVVVRVNDSYALALRIETDESNAAGCGRDYSLDIFIYYTRIAVYGSAMKNTMANRCNLIRIFNNTMLFIL